MATIKHRGNDIHTSGELPSIGSVSPSFKLTDAKLQDVSLEDFAGKKKILNIFPSLDTSTCAASVHNFYKLANNLDNVVVLNISMDLPFAQSRFCGAEGLQNVVTLSGFRSSFGNDYGLTIIDGLLKGLYSRVVIVLNENNHILYTAQISEIADEPNYQNAISAAQ